MVYLNEIIYFLVIDVILLTLIFRKYKYIASPVLLIPTFIFANIVFGNINLIFFQKVFGWFVDVRPSQGNFYACLGLTAALLVILLLPGKKNEEYLSLLHLDSFDKYLIIVGLISIVLNAINYSKLGGLVILKGGLSGYERFSLRNQLPIPKALPLASFLIGPLVIRVAISSGKRPLFIALLCAQILLAFGMGDRHLIFIPALIGCLFLYYTNKISTRTILIFVACIPFLLMLSSFFRGDSKSVALASTDSYFGAEYRDYLRLTNDKFKFQNGATMTSVFFNAIPKQVYQVLDLEKEDYSIYSAYILKDMWGNETGQRSGIWGEFYLNYGYMGLLICFVFFSIGLKLLDNNLVKSPLMTRKKMLLCYVFSLFFFSVFGSWATIGDDLGTNGLYYCTLVYFSFRRYEWKQM